MASTSPSGTRAEPTALTAVRAIGGFVALLLVIESIDAALYIRLDG